MSIIVFTGPTIDADEARQVLAAEYRPPAKVGDVLAAALSEPDAVVLIDGLFDSTPAVWHKEILFALSAGTRVYGASSMGALRAAELHTFGMIGVGKIYEMYRDGVLEDDDEVAVTCSVDDGHAIARSEAMVNIREVLEHAAATNAIGADTRDRLARKAKALHYPDRSWALLLAEASGEDVPALEVAQLRQFLQSHATNLKRADAVQLLERVAADEALGFPPVRPAFTFERTTLFEALRETVAIMATGDSEAEVLRFAAQSPDGATLTRHALLLALAAAEIHRRGIQLSIEELLDHEARFLTERGLDTPHRLTAWLADNQLGADGLLELIRLDACVERIVRDRGAALDRFLLAELRRRGELTALLESFRASGK